MRVLIIGVTGTGKSYLVDRMKKLGLNAIDSDSSYGLAWMVNAKGREVKYNPGVLPLGTKESNCR